VTVEEVATLATRFGWSYETLLAMSGAERRLWLAAADRVAATAGAGPAGPTTPVGPRVTTEAERRARLLALHEELNHRGKR
jgi:hypothetical protein